MSDIISYKMDIHPDVYDASIDIIQKIGMERVLQQLVEECSELSQASLELIRSSDSENPTNKTYDECYENWFEEIADVLVALVVASDDLNSPYIENIFKRKLFRWVDRINNNENVESEEQK